MHLALRHQRLLGHRRHGRHILARNKLGRSLALAPRLHDGLVRDDVSQLSLAELPLGARHLEANRVHKQPTLAVIGSLHPLVQKDLEGKKEGEWIKS